MRIALYNIRYGTGTGLDFHLPVPFSGYFRSSVVSAERIWSFLDELDADVLCLVEVDNGSYRNFGRCQAGTLAAKNGWHHAFACKYHKGSVLRDLPILWSQGNAIISRMPLKSVREHSFSRGMKRTFLEAQFEGFTVTLAHLSLGKAARKEQMLELARHARTIEGPMFLGGDLNTFKGKKELVPLMEEAGLRDTDAEGRPTYPSHNPRRRLDYLLSSPDVSITSFDVPKTSLSDHLPLVCDFEISPERTTATAG
ncbi:MAG: endonuclease/exonuclease/phosphatase family protein [Thermovirgaceae bacterium]